MKTIFTSKTRVISLILAIVMAFGLAACSDGKTTIENAGSNAAITAPSPEGLPRGHGSTGGNQTSGLPRGNSGKTKTDPEKELKIYGDIETVVKSVKTPTKYDGQTTSISNKYGTVDWSTANQGYVTFTAKGQTREFILESPDGVQSIFEVAKGTSIKATLVDGTGKYQYAIANIVNDKTHAYNIQYKNSFTVKTIDSDLAPFLVSTPWGDYANATEAAKKAKELWDGKKTQLENVETVADWVSDLNYDKKLKQGGADVYVNPDSVIKNGGGVCNEFSKLLTAMLRSQGIPAYYQTAITQSGTQHAFVRAWIELETTTKNGMTYSKGAWIAIEAVDGNIKPKSQAKANYDTDALNYAG